MRSKMVAHIRGAVGYLAVRLRWIRKWCFLPVTAWIEGDRFMATGNFIRAVESYEKGLQTAPRHPARYSVMFRLAHCYCKTGHFRDAIRLLSSMTEAETCLREAFARKARLELWLCRPRDAMHTVRKAFGRMEPDPEMAALYLLAAVEAGDSGRHHEEARMIAKRLAAPGKAHNLLKLALARSDYQQGLKHRAKLIITQICSGRDVPLDALIALGELYLREGNIGYSRNYLRRALALSPQHPRTQALIAESYLVEGPGYQPEYALQLASNACRASLWEYPQSMHVLAEAFYQCGMKTDALLVANRARRVATKSAIAAKRIPDLEYLI